MALAGVLGGLSVVLSVTPFLGFIPLPFLGGVSATTMHIPVIIGAITAGPFVGLFVGLIFGISSFLRATPAFFADPLVSILPRIFIGLTAYGTYKLSRSSILAAIVGTATNTIGVLTMIYVLGYLRPLSVVLGIAAVNGTAEVIISAIIVYAIMKLLKKLKF
ncbi:ECF transporter S component [Alkaliphilus serpentinus]|uniref:ECF transporter S component n=2 Tax=Alkaliphilus serpentinus TaxID=1482731 RepID=A0A833HRR6_9FIRM|nr:ECF transporter S component [Alkaliphilus serpentinus]KAB3533811.1 ECF transporter S component [Alkaliphilus serpentinus]